MRKLIEYIFIVTFISTCIFSQVDSSVAKAPKVKTVEERNDSNFVHIISYPNQTWFERNEGALVGAFLAGLIGGIIAIVTVYLTARSNKIQRLEREKDIYCGLLYAVKVELIYHKKNHDNLIKELQVILHNSLQANEIITDEPSRTISLSHLQEIRSKIMSTELFNTKILLFLSAYINKCELVNCDVNFERLITLDNKFKDMVNFTESTKTYFHVVIKQIQDLQQSIPTIIGYINADLKSLGKTSDINESEYLRLDV